jgi:hypothetical protein
MAPFMIAKGFTTFFGIKVFVIMGDTLRRAAGGRNSVRQ